MNTKNSNLNTVNLKLIPDHGGRLSKIDSNESIELWKDLFLRFMVKRFQRSSQVQFPSC